MSEPIKKGATALVRLRAWVDGWSVGRYEGPTYKNPGELKADLRLLIEVADAADRFLDLDFGYLNEPTKEGLQPLIVTLEALRG